MRFAIQRSALLEALQTVHSVVEKKNTVAILGNVLCSVQGRELSLSATDLEVGIKVSLTLPQSTHLQDGRVTLAAKHFTEIVKELPEKEVLVSRRENDWVEILCGKSRFNIVSLAADEFPALPEFEEKKYTPAQSKSLAELIDSTQFAVSTDATRYHLNGVYFENVDNGIMRMTATDGHRLSLMDHEIFLNTPELKRGVIVPKKGLSEIRKLLGDLSKPVGLGFERGYIFAQMDKTYLFVRLIDGEYPDYRLVVPKAADQIALVAVSDFISALKRVSLLSNEKGRGVKLSLARNLMTITSSNPDMGEAREELDIEFDHEGLEIGFNSKYLLDCLQVLKSEKVEFHLKDRLSPGILRESGRANHTYVIMPMRI